MHVVYTLHSNCDHILHLGCYAVTILTYIWVIPYLVLIGYEQTAYIVNEGETVTVCASVMSGIPSSVVIVNVNVLPQSASAPTGKLISSSTFITHYITYQSSSLDEQCSIMGHILFYVVYTKLS